MAIYYVYSGAGGSNNGSTWANAFTTLTTAFVTEAAGDTLYVAHDHAESTAGAVTLSSSGTVANPTKVVCVNRAGSVPPVSADRRTTAQVSTTAANNMAFSGFTHYDGIIFNAGSSTGTAQLLVPNTGVTSTWLRFDNCSLRCVATSASNRVAIGTTASANGIFIELNNTTVSFANVSQGIAIGEGLRWRNTPSAVLAASIPTTLFLPGANWAGQVECIGVDFSAVGAGKTIVGANATATNHAYRFVDCKLAAGVTKSDVPLAHGATEVDFIRSGSAGVNYTVHRHRMSGLLTEETATVRSSGGASDGTTPISWRVITTANCNYSMPFECPPVAVWNDTTGSAKTATVEGTWTGGTLPNDDEIWIDVEYLGDASSPQGSFANDGKANLLTTAAAQTSSSETWSGTSSVTLNGITSGVTMSNGNLTATHGAAVTNSGAVSVMSNSTGKYYFEATFTATNGTSDCVGILLSTGTLTTLLAGTSCTTVFATSSGTIWSNNGASGKTLGGNIVAGDVVGVAIDLTAHKGWFRRNAGNWNGLAIGSENPATGTGGVTIAAGSFSPVVGFGGATPGNVGDNITVNFGATSYTQTPPSGFGNWSVSYTPFKLATTFTPQQKGWVYARVKVGAAARTAYVDPLVTLT